MGCLNSTTENVQTTENQPSVQESAKLKQDNSALSKSSKASDIPARKSSDSAGSTKRPEVIGPQSSLKREGTLGLSSRRRAYIEREKTDEILRRSSEADVDRLTLEAKLKKKRSFPDLDESNDPDLTPPG
eukprot:376273_1